MPERDNLQERITVINTNATTGKNATEKLLWLLFGNRRGILATRYGRADGTEDFFKWPEEAPEAVNRLHVTSQGGRDAYFCAHLLTERKRQKPYAAEVSALWSETDDAEIPAGVPEPSIRVESSPGRYHDYWLLSRPISPKLAEELNKRLYRAIGGDSGWHLGKLLRAPGTRNYKYPDAPTVRIAEASEHLYDPDELDRALPPLPEKNHRREIETNAPPVRLRGHDREVWDGLHPVLKDDKLDRSETLYKIGATLLDVGATRSATVKALQERDVALGYKKYTGRANGEGYEGVVDEWERRGGGTSQHHNVPSNTPVMLNHRKNPVAISFSTGGRPEPRRWVVENILPERFPTTLYGDSGKAKSFVAAHLGQAIADPGSAEWMGYPVQAGPVLYLDFEMDEIEQRRRAYDIAAGRGEAAPPNDYLYMECVEFTPNAVFNTAYDLCVERDVKLVIIDSMGMAIEGDSETSSDTNAFYRNYINPLRSLDVATLVIDHQAKKQKGETYENKDIFGSTYKKANSRNVFQINGDWHGNELRATLRHTKSNLGPQLKDIHLGITFEGGRVTLSEREADTGGASQSDLIALHLSDYGPSTAAAIGEALGMGERTVRNRLGEMNGKRVEKAGKVDRAQLWRALDEHHNGDTRDIGTLGPSPKLTDAV